MWHIQYFPIIDQDFSFIVMFTGPKHFHTLSGTYSISKDIWDDLSFYDYRLLNHTANTICISRVSPAHLKGKTSSVGARKGHHLIKKTMYICISTHCLTKQQTTTTSTAPHRVSEQRTWGYSMNKGNYFPLWKLWLVM